MFCVFLNKFLVVRNLKITNGINGTVFFLFLVLERVEGGFTLPANNASLRVQNLLDKFEMIFDKLRELRTYMNNATATANSASTTNAINRQNLADVTTQIEGKRNWVIPK